MRLRNELGFPDKHAIDDAAYELALEYVKLYPDGKARTPAEFVDELFRVKDEISKELNRQL